METSRVDLAVMEAGRIYPLLAQSIVGLYISGKREPVALLGVILYVHFYGSTFVWGLRRAVSFDCEVFLLVFFIT